MTEYQLLIIEGMMKLENHEKILKLGGEIWMSLCKYLFLRILPKKLHIDYKRIYNNFQGEIW